jgi:hypothetical protein
MGGSSDKAKPTKIDFNDISRYVNAMGKNMPATLEMEGKYRPEFQGLNLGDMSSFLQGSKGNKGLVKQAGQLTDQAGRQIGMARRDELRQMEQQSGMARGFFQSLSPESARMVEYANQNAMTAQQNAMGLTGQEARSAQQFAREGAADRGRVMDNSAMAAEVLNRDNILGQKRQEAYGATQNAYNLANSFYTAPGLQALSSVPNSYQAGQGYLGMGLNSIGSARPQLISMDAGLNLASANAQNANAAGAANAQAAATRSAGYVGAGAATGAAVGTAIFPGVGTAVGGLIGAGAGYVAGR